MILEKKSMIKFQKMTDSFGLPGFVTNASIHCDLMVVVEA